MSKDQANVYNAITKKLDPVMAYKVKKNMPMSSKELSKMNFFMSAVRQVSNDADKFGYNGVTPKVQKIVDDTVNEKNKDKNFKGLIYSNYLNSGINKIESELNDYGIRTKKYNGKMSDKSKQDAVNKYNNNEIDVLLVSSAGSEGLDLKGTKLVQITEPHWNKTRIDQVIGRAARFKSHSELPENERVVKVKRYHSTLPTSDTSADEYLYNLSVEKDELNNQILDILKEEGSRKYINVNT
jgi:SNF2 family DNA or RNA helicase